jgi:ABC-type bacteriocin/lantibiotic exporter with double-glycine peptidase domain
MEKIKKIIYLLGSSERKSVGLLLIMILLMSILDTVGVASIMPFLAILLNPELIKTNSILNEIFIYFNFSNEKYFLLTIGFFVFFVFVSSLAFKALTIYLQMRFIYMQEFNIGKRLIESYLRQPYKWFLNNQGTELGKNILSEVSQVVNQAIGPMLNLIVHGMLVLAIFILLIIFDTILTISVVLVLILLYGIVFKLTKSWLITKGNESLKKNAWRYKIVTEVFSAIKEIKAKGIEDFYIDRFILPAKKYAENFTNLQIVSQLPRYFFEAIAFGGILIIALYFLFKTDVTNYAIPAIALYAFAGYKIFPSLQQIFAATTSLRFVSSSLDVIYNDLRHLKSEIPNNNHNLLAFDKSINLEKISFCYPNAVKFALEDVTINIKVKSLVGFVGFTGSGKTTLVDIILGILEPQKGLLKIDDKIITKHNLRSWQSKIGYVPQQIYLADDTVANNIVFGLDTNNINKENLERVAKVADIHNFIINELPKGYDTIIGERGERLSGGQRQRIGIARALYQKPELLILDEATNALDNITEELIMESILNLDNRPTIILIAHRLNSIKKCAQIFLLENGKILVDGTYEYLKLHNSKFKKFTLGS